MIRCLSHALIVSIVATSASFADDLAPVSQRFAKAGVKETPDFQRHVVPLFGRLGCNGRACHGSFQGRGGFRLSLFGYDFDADHKAIAGGEAPRALVKNSANSLILLKPTKTVAHGGGERFKKNGWEYNLLRRWIENGAKGMQEKAASFESLEVAPQEIVYSKIGQTAQLKIIAAWSDGTREDVTPLCRFRTNDESIATISDSGTVAAVGKGGTDVIVFYDNGVVAVPVILPVSDRAGRHYPKLPAPTKIDELVLDRLRKLGIVPADLCSDTEFLRRVSLDLTGTLPGPAEVTAFLADKSLEKRQKKIDELLQRPAYAAWWTTRLCDATGNTEANGPLGGERGLNREKADQWYKWVYQRVRDNTPYDKLVEGIVLAVSRRPGQSFDDYCAEMSSYFNKEKPVDFAARKDMPYYWMRRNAGQPEAKALSFAHAFLGLSLQCAQCHKHPYDQWTKQDFDQFSDFFYGVRYNYSNRSRTQELKVAAGLGKLDQDSGKYRDIFRKLAHQGKLLPYKEVMVPVRRKTTRRRPRPRTRAGRVITPKLLGGAEVVAADYNDPRQPLMDWMRHKDNPYFARAFVNRVWANYFGVGIIDPPDDLNLANPPSNPALLDYLANGLVQNGYDMKWLHRQITNSQAYQRSWRSNKTNKLDERNFSRAVLRRLPAEVVFDAIVFATASGDARQALVKDPITTRAIGMASGHVNRRGSHYAVQLFGKPARQLNCDCERSNEPSLLQTVYLRNDQEIYKLLERKDGWLKQVARSKKKEPQSLVRQAYLRTLSRLPNAREQTIAMSYLQKSDNAYSGMRDLMWALLNTKEFILNH